jgi:DNA-nicking Smr family endonuclease
MMDEQPVRIPIEDWIDLHTFSPKEVADLVPEYLAEAAKKGYPAVRIIHGRGIGVQRSLVHRILNRHPAVRTFEDTQDRGATIAYLDLPA